MNFSEFFLDNNCYYYSYQFFKNTSLYYYPYTIYLMDSFYFLNNNFSTYSFNVSETIYLNYSFYNLGYSLIFSDYFSNIFYNNDVAKYFLSSNGFEFSYWKKDDNKDEIDFTLFTAYPLREYYWYSFFSDFFLNYKKSPTIFPKGSFYKFSKILLHNYLNQNGTVADLNNYKLLFNVVPESYYFSFFYNDILTNIIKNLKLTFFYNTIPSIDYNYYILRGYLSSFSYTLENGLKFFSLNNVLFSFLDYDKQITYSDYIFKYHSKLENFISNDFLNVKNVNFFDFFSGGISIKNYKGYNTLISFDYNFDEYLKLFFRNHNLFSNFNFMFKNLNYYFYTNSCSFNFLNQELNIQESLNKKKLFLYFFYK
jgi:hypothetical protein